jgi:hypothetical protein
MQRAIEVCEAKGLTCEDRGALLVDLTKYKMDKAIIRKAGKWNESKRADWTMAAAAAVAVARFDPR